MRATGGGDAADAHLGRIGTDDPGATVQAYAVGVEGPRPCRRNSGRTQTCIRTGGPGVSVVLDTSAISTFLEAEDGIPYGEPVNTMAKLGTLVSRSK